MAKMRAPSRRLTAEEPPVKPEVTVVDFSASEGRLNYIRAKLDDIMTNIGTVYSERLTKELLRRLEKTVQEFHQEVLSILDRLEQIELLREQAKKPVVEAPMSEKAEEESPELAGLSEWERRLELLEKEKEETAATAEPPREEKKTKKGLFHRK